MTNKNIPLPQLDSHCMRYQPRPTTRRQMLMQAACGFGYLALADLVTRGSSTDAPSSSKLRQTKAAPPSECFSSVRLATIVGVSAESPIAVP